MLFASDPLSTSTACIFLCRTLVVRTDMEVSIAHNIIVNIVAVNLHMETQISTSKAPSYT